tara:strand:+ start:339 stop:461 length:123 start_codon:yes stop_codon:yes gene_type:complete
MSSGRVAGKPDMLQVQFDQSKVEIKEALQRDARCSADTAA